MPEGVVKRLTIRFWGWIAQGGNIAARRLSVCSVDHLFPWLVLIPILGFFFLKDGRRLSRSALAMLPRGRIRWRGDEFFQDVNSTLAALHSASTKTACL